MFHLRLDTYTTFVISYLQLVTGILITWFQDSYGAFRDMDYYYFFNFKPNTKTTKN